MLRKRIEQDIINRKNLDSINIAIKTLSEENKKISVKSISDLTGIDYHIVYGFEEVKKYVVKKNRSKNRVKKENIKKDIIEQDIESYISHIKDVYFIHPEEIQTVLIDMAISLSVFHPALFHVAINKLKLDGTLKMASSLTPLKFIIEQTPIARESEELNTVFNIAPGITAPQPIIEPKPVAIEPLKEMPTYEMYYQIPLSNGDLVITHNSNLTDDDKQDIREFLEMLSKRKFK